jgi:hypothetical protein
MSVSNELDYQETISLLQEEIVRLEEEVRARDEALANVETEPRNRDTSVDDEAGRQIAALTAELTARDETIGLLLEQSRLFEEAEAANQANYRQLDQWVSELEQRVEQRSGEDDVRAELAAMRQKAESDRAAAEAERRTWAVQKQQWETETERLRTALSQAARASDTADLTALDTLEKENRRLREATGELARLSAAAAEADSLREEVQSAKDELTRTRRSLQESLDDREREKKEHEAALADLRSHTARESLKRQEGHVHAAVAGPAGSNPLLVADERIRELRDHLKEIHEREEKERAERRLSARLSRLWRHTAPRA